MIFHNMLDLTQRTNKNHKKSTFRVCNTCCKRIGFTRNIPFSRFPDAILEWYTKRICIYLNRKKNKNVILNFSQQHTIQIPDD